MRPGSALLCGTSLIFAALFASCDDPGEPGEPSSAAAIKSVAVTAEQADLIIGDSTILQATAYNASQAAIASVHFTWSVSDSAIASIDASGVLRARRAGTVRVTATAQGVIGYLDVAALQPLLSPEPVHSLIASGIENRCAISAEQDAYCWGWNGHGGIIFVSGNPSTLLAVGDTAADILTPRKVVGNLKFIDIASSEDSRSLRCGVATDRSAYCWGQLNWMAELWEVPTRLPGAVQFNTLSGGRYHFCGVDVGGDVFCWGDNGSGQAGAPPSAAFETPRKVELPERMVAVAAGGSITCALSLEGRIFCWGTYSQAVGAPSPNPAKSFPPTPITGTRTFTRIYASGETLCALDRAGSVFCWKSQAGARPVSSGIQLRFRSITVEQHQCGLATDGKGYCWGPNPVGQLGNGETAGGGLPPTAIAGNHTFAELSAGSGESTCGLTTTRELYCWGSRVRGQLGDGWSNVRRTPVAVLGGPFATFTAYSRSAHCALTTDSRAFCWGDNSGGQLGDGTTISRRVPTMAATNTRFRTLTTHLLQTCGTSVDSIAYCWGPQDPWRSSLSSTAPVAVNATLKFTTVTPGWEHACGLTMIGAAYCWGQGHMGALGGGDFLASAAPRAVVGDLAFTQLHASFDYTCALSTTRDVYCWGATPDSARSGDSLCKPLPVFANPVPCTSSPKRVTGLPPIREISTEPCAIGFNDDLYCWNANGTQALPDIRASNFAGVGHLPLEQRTALRVFDVNGDLYNVESQGSGFALVKKQSPMRFTTLAGQCGISTAVTYCWGASYAVGDGVQDYAPLPQRIPFPGQ